MSEHINDGGPAFPATVSFNRDTGEMIPHQFGNHDFKTLGLSLRDYFAAKAMPAMMDLFYEAMDNGEVDDEIVAMRGYASDAYMWADAMLAAREVAK